MPYVAFGHDGSFLILDRRRRLLFGGSLPAAEGAAIDRWVASIPESLGLLSLRPHAGASIVCIWSPRDERARFAWVGADRDPQHREVTCRSAPAFVGESVVYLRDERSIRRERIDGRGDAEEWTLPEGLCGPVEVMVAGETIFVVAPDRERLVDVRTGKSLSRKLPAAERETRHAFLTYTQRWDAAMRQANAEVKLVDLAPPRWGGGHAPSYSWPEPQSLLALLITGNMVNAMQTDEGGRYGLGRHQVALTLHRLDAGAMAETLSRYSTLGLGLLRGLLALEYALAGCFGRLDDPDRPPRRQEPFDSAALHLLLATTLACVRSDRTMISAHDVTELAEGTVRPEDVIAVLTPTGEDRPGHWSAVTPNTTETTQCVLAWLVLATFGAASLPIFVEWLLVRPTERAEQNASRLVEIVQQMVRFYPETEAPLSEAMAQVGQGNEKATRFARMIRDKLTGSLILSP